MRARLAEEISDVAQEYELFLHEHVENTRAARMAATEPFGRAARGRAGLKSKKDTK
jgi:hypothetical protein